MHTGGLVGKYTLAPCPLQGGEPYVRVVVICGDAAVPDFHVSILTLISDGYNLLFLQDQKSATKF
jgi:hypothetical protein